MNPSIDASYWINRNSGIVVDSDYFMGHLVFVGKNPEKFGLTPDEVKDIDQPYSENIHKKLYDNWIQVSRFRYFVTAFIRKITSKDIEILQDFIYQLGYPAPKTIRIEDPIKNPKVVYIQDTSDKYTEISYNDFLLAKNPRDLLFQNEQIKMKSLSALFREALQTIKLPKTKNPFKQDLRIGGGQERDGGQSKTYHSDYGSYSTSGSGYTTQGTKGFSRAAKEFDIPQDSIPLDKSAVDETEEIWKDDPVGQRVPELGFGGRGGAGIKTLYLGPRKR